MNRPPTPDVNNDKESEPTLQEIINVKVRRGLLQQTPTPKGNLLKKIVIQQTIMLCLNKKIGTCHCHLGSTQSCLHHRGDIEDFCLL